MRPVVGDGEHTYEVVHDWGELPASIRYGNTHGVCEDSQGRIYVLHTVHETSESRDAMVVFDADGRFAASWGSEFAGGAHGLHVEREDGEEFLYLTDTIRGQVVKTTVDGEEVLRLGYPHESERYDGETPYSPTNVAVAPNGDLYVADGYGSSYVNRYDRAGTFIGSFGGAGSEPGRLSGPHGIVVDVRGEEPVLTVADRTNRRLQHFTLDGEHLGFSGGVELPCHFDQRDGMLVVPDLAARVTLLDRRNEVVAHLGQGADDWKELRTRGHEHFAPGAFICPHSACFDREGNIFVVEWVEVGRVTKLRRV